MGWPDPSLAQSLSLVVGDGIGGDLVLTKKLVSSQFGNPFLYHELTREQILITSMESALTQA